MFNRQRHCQGTYRQIPEQQHQRQMQETSGAKTSNYHRHGNTKKSTTGGFVLQDHSSMIYSQLAIIRRVLLVIAFKRVETNIRNTTVGGLYSDACL